MAGLKRKLTFWPVFCIASGAMISSGLFVLPGQAFKMSGPAVVLAYALAALLVIPALVSKAELATAMPKSGGDYFYVERSLGTLAGTRQVSESRALAIEQALGSLRAKYSERTPLKVFYEIWNEPLQTINGEHLISQLVALCGGRNIFADVATLGLEAGNVRGHIVAGGKGDHHKGNHRSHGQHHQHVQKATENVLSHVAPLDANRPLWAWAAHQGIELAICRPIALDSLTGGT